MSSSFQSKRLALVNVLGISVLLTACSKTVDWEEEVLLNTGETIFVKRSVPWELSGGSGAGNIADIAMRPIINQQTFTFTYHTKKYQYSEGADVGLIAISPISKVPVLVARPESWGWNINNTYACTVPFYLQLNPDVTGVHWSWPERIESWLYNLPTNLMEAIPKPKEKKSLPYTMSEKYSRDEIVRTQSPTYTKIDPAYKSDSCYTKQDIERSKQPAEWTKK